MGAAIAACIALAGTTAGPSARLIFSMVVGVPAFVLLIISRRELGESFAVAPRAKALITSGFYSRIQHPMYLFLDLFLLSLIVALGLPALIVAWVVLAIVQVIQSRREEELLSTAFGAEYEAYRNHTWM